MKTEYASKQFIKEWSQLAQPVIKGAGVVLKNAPKIGKTLWGGAKAIKKVNIPGANLVAKHPDISQLLAYTGLPYAANAAATSVSTPKEYVSPEQQEKEYTANIQNIGLANRAPSAIIKRPDYSKLMGLQSDKTQPKFDLNTALANKTPVEPIINIPDNKIQTSKTPLIQNKGRNNKVVAANKKRGNKLAKKIANSLIGQNVIDAGAGKETNVVDIPTDTTSSIGSIVDPLKPYMNIKTAGKVALTAAGLVAAAKLAKKLLAKKEETDIPGEISDIKTSNNNVDDENA